jgi:hypothetical protein
MVSAKVQMKEMGTAAELIGDINRVEAALRMSFSQVRWIFFEPDLKD